MTLTYVSCVVVFKHAHELSDALPLVKQHRIPSCSAGQTVGVAFAGRTEWKWQWIASETKSERCQDLLLDLSVTCAGGSQLPCHQDAQEASERPL